MAVSEGEGILSVLILNAKKSKFRSRSAISYPMKANGAGRKGEQKRRERVYTQINTSNTMKNPFTEIWHNNNPFVICFTTEVPTEKNRCGYCGKEFPIGVVAIRPFDIVIKHKERWQYLNRNRRSEQDPEYLPSSAKTPTTRFYCIRKKWIYNRFPYFTSALLEVDSEVSLTKSHKILIKEQLDDHL